MQNGNQAGKDGKTHKRKNRALPPGEVTLGIK
jgi:hypothetical protein